MDLYNTHSRLEKFCRHLAHLEAESFELSSEHTYVLEQFSERILSDLERVYEQRLVSSVWFVDWFLTDEGRAELSDIFPDAPRERLALRRFLYEHQDDIRALESDTRQTYAKCSRQGTESEIQAYLISCINRNGEMVRPQRTSPTRVITILDLERLKTKIETLTALSERVVNLQRDLEDEVTGIQGQEFISDVADMYQERIRELLYSAYISAYPLVEKHDVLGESGLNDMETEILEMIPFDAPYTSWSEFADELDATRYRSELTHVLGLSFSEALDVLSEYAQEVHLIYKTYRFEREKLEDSLSEEDYILSQTMKEKGEWILSQYGLLSKHEAYERERKGAAPDGKWKVVLTSTSHLRVLGDQKVVWFSENTSVSPPRAFAVAFGHEIEGHVLQHENKEQVTCDLFRYVGGARRMLLAEGGAEYVEQRVFQHLYDIQTMNGPGYVAATRARLNGGGYFDCVRAAFEANIKAYSELWNEGQLSEEEWEDAIQSRLSASMSQVRRVMRDGPFEPNGGYVTNSKDLVYLEQRLIMDLLKKYGLETYAFVGGMSFTNLEHLLRWNLISESEIIEPQLYALEVEEKTGKEK